MTQTPTPRRKFRLTLRGMFVLITVLGAVMGWVVMVVNNYRQELQAVNYLIREHNARTRTESWSYSIKTSRPFLDGGQLPWRIHRPVRHVTIEGKTLDEKFWKALSDVKHLESLALRDCTLQTTWVGSQNRGLASLSLRDCKLQTTGDEFSRLAPLRSLVISNTSLASHDIQAIGTHETLESLYLLKIPDGAERYTPQLKEMRNLINLTFSDSPISASALRDICQAQSVLNLHFDGAQIDWSEAHHLAHLENLGPSAKSMGDFS